jgi:aromatase
MSAHTDNDVLIQAPVELAWSIANDIPAWPSLFGGEYAAAEVLERIGNRVVFRLTTVPMTDGRTFSWISERVLDEERKCVAARRLELGAFRYMSIVHCFQEQASGMRLRWIQDFEMRDDAPFTDQQMAERINRSSRAHLHNHKRLIEEAAANNGGRGGLG